MTENSQLFYSQNLFTFVENHWFAILYVSNLIVCLWANRGYPDHDTKSFNFLGSLVPGFGFLVGLNSVYKIVQRVSQSKGKCTFGHEMIETYSSEKEKWKNGRMPLRVSIGGYEKYACQKCNCEETVRWKAF